MRLWTVTCRTRSLVRRGERMVRGPMETAHRFVTMAATQEEAVAQVREAEPTLDDAILRGVDEEPLGWTATLADPVVLVGQVTRRHRNEAAT